MKQRSTTSTQRTRPLTHHQILLALMRAGVSFSEAQTLGMEEMLCMLIHQRLEEALTALDAEAARVASIPFAEYGEQQQALTVIHHHAEAELDRFYREM